jgi:hypothetical protein
MWLPAKKRISQKFFLFAKERGIFYAANMCFRFRLCLLVVPLALLMAPLPLKAASAPKVLVQSGFWTAYKMTEGGQPVCYMSLTLRASKDKSLKLKRDDVVLMITHRPADNTVDVVSYTAGLKFKKASEVTVVAGSKTFNLFTQGDTAWSRDVATDRALAAAIRNGTSLTIRGLTARETAINDKLSLKGSFDAYVAINKACGMPAPERPVKAKKAPRTKPLKKKKR